MRRMNRLVNVCCFTFVSVAAIFFSATAFVSVAAAVVVADATVGDVGVDDDVAVVVLKGR